MCMNRLITKLMAYLTKKISRKQKSHDLPQAKFKKAESP